MALWIDALGEVAELNRSVKPEEAASRFSAFLDECPVEELRELSVEIEQTLGTFLPKRRRTLQAKLEQRQRAGDDPKPAGDVLARPQGLAGERRLPSANSHHPSIPQRTTAPTFREPSIAATPVAPSTTEEETDARRKLMESALAAVEQLNREVQPTLAQAKFQETLEYVGDDGIEQFEHRLRESLATFLPKRRRAMSEQLDAMLRAAVTAKSEAPSAIYGRQNASPPVAVSEVSVQGLAEAPARRKEPTPPRVGSSPASAFSYNRQKFSQDLDELGKRHIFQWSTFYRETLSQYFDAFLLNLTSADRSSAWLNLTKAALSHHATDIFQRGFQYQLSSNGSGPHYAIQKSLAGLQRLLDLPLEFYSARLASAHRSGTALQLRQLCSAMTSGILIGYSHAMFGQVGGAVLPRFPGSWAHVLPFLTADDMRELCSNLEPGELLDGIHDSILPLALALDGLLQRDAAIAPLPALSQYTDSSRRIEVSLQLAPKAEGLRRIEVHAYISPRFVDRMLIEEAAARAVGVVLAPLRADLRIQLLNVERLSDIVVATGESGGEAPQIRSIALLQELIDETRLVRGNRPIDFNFASEFPLESPFLTRYSHVYRSSVRRLMQSFERRNGVRLWCSVRRSGKTTACASDLGSTSSQSVVVTQTCDPTGQIADGDVFYRNIKQALTAGGRLDDSFVARTVAECLPSRVDTRVVLVLDEYETLFGDLKTSMDREPSLRYTVVQPLLNQLVAFTRDNLLIFMGQQPNAHWILMDQNQLSPVVMQDTFPLFPHERGASGGEFYELVHKIMSSHVDLEPSFVDRLYEETGGHPFLTGKLLVSFWDWLIANNRPASDLAPMRPELFAQFTAATLNPTSIGRNDRYEMFKRAASDHLSRVGRSADPWLHSVYSAMRTLVLSSPESFSLPLDDFLSLTERDCVGISPEELLASASRANFLTFDDHRVHLRIRLLGRVAAAVRRG